MSDITPKYYIPTSAEIPGGLSVESNPDLVVSSGTMVQPKKDEASTMIGSIKVGANEISQGFGNNIFKVSSLGVHLGAANFADAPFSVDMQGNLHATSGTFSGDITGASGTFAGTITATTGSIGGFNIGTDYIRDSANSFGLASTVTGSNDVRFWSGATFANRATAPLRLYEDGSIIGTNATFTGSLFATSGWIGSATALVYESQGINTGVTGWIRGGQTGYNTGVGYFLGYSSGAYKLSIGNTVNYLNWDGDTLEIAGKLKIGGLVINVATTDSIQDAIDEVNAAGGGTVILASGTHRPGGNITLYSSVTLAGQTQNGAIIDFENGAYGIIAQGSNAYSTGTVSVSAGGTTVTGSGTTFTSAMVGRSILLSGIWYTVASFTSTTEISISIPFADVALSGAAYVIANILTDISIEKLTIQNSTSSAINFQYVGEFLFDRIAVIAATTGSQIQDCSNITTNNIDFVYCGTALSATRCHFWTASYCGDIDSTTKGFDLNSCTRFQITSNFLLGSTGNGITVTSCSVALISLNAVRENGGKGIELVSGNSNIQISSNNIQANASDGIKLTATSDDCDIMSNQLIGNGGYGWNIAASTCDTNNAIGNHFSSNSSGTYSDSGTGTVINEGALVDIVRNQTIGGVKTFSSDPLIPDEAYGSGWNGVLEPPTKNAVYDKVETLQKQFGAPTTGLSAGTVYQAATDGFIFGDCNDNNANPKWEIYSDGNNPPTTLIMKFNQETAGVEDRPFCCPIKKNNYYKLEVTNCTVTRYAFIGFNA